MTAIHAPLPSTAPAPSLARNWRQEVESRGGRHFELAWTPYESLADELAQQGVEIRPYTIDIERFERYIDQCGYRDMVYWQQYGQRGDGVVLKKCLEHYISIDLMAPRPGEVAIDIASCKSPFPDLLTEHWGVRAYRQDYTYPPRLEGDRIGGDASALPLPDGFADLLTLHCSFEHFEGERDMRFLREAYRVLKPGGRLCIVPLYTSRRYAIQTDPDTWGQRPLNFEPDTLVYLAEGWGERHARSYDTEHFLERIVAHLGGFELVLYAVENFKDVAPDCYLHHAALLSKPATGSGGSELAKRAEPAALGLDDEQGQQMLRENAELQHLLEERETEVRGLRYKAQHLEKIVEQIEVTNTRAARAYEEEITELRGVVEHLDEDIGERDQRLGNFQTELERAYRTHEEALELYQRELDDQKSAKLLPAESEEEIQRLRGKVSSLAEKLGGTRTQLATERSRHAAFVELVEGTAAWRLRGLLLALRRRLSGPS
jgi:SAM-dependent methyltransferase